MPKCKLKFNKKDVAKIDDAALLADVNVNKENAASIGNDVIVEVSYRQGSQLFEMGRYLENLKSNSNEKSE